MKRIKQESNEEEPARWQNTMDVVLDPDNRVGDIPYPTQGWVHKRFCYSRQSSTNDNSQQFYGVYLRQLESPETTASYYLNAPTNADSTVIMQEEGLFWRALIEGDINVIFLGGYMMSPWNVNRTTDTAYGGFTQCYFGYQFTNPTDGVRKYMAPLYTLQKPANYSALMGFEVGGAPYSRNGYIKIFLKTFSLYDNDYPNASFICRIVRENSIYPPVVWAEKAIDPTTETIIFDTTFSQLMGGSYYLEILVKNGTQTLYNRFDRLNITVYLGASLVGARMSGVKSTSFSMQTDDPGRFAHLRFGILFDDFYEFNPTNQLPVNPYPYVQLYVKPVLQNPTSRQFRASCFIGYEHENPFYRLFVNKPIDSGTLISCETGGKNQTGYKFSVEFAKSMITTNNSLKINVLEYEDAQNTKISTLLTMCRSTKSLLQLINQAQLTPNVLTTSTDYIFTCARSMHAIDLGISLTFQIFAMYVDDIPVPPEQKEGDGIIPIQEAAVEEGQEILKNHGRDLTSAQLLDEQYQYAIDNYLKTDEPTDVQKSRAYTYYEPGQIESFEKGKEQLWAFLKDEAKGWSQAPLNDLHDLLSDKTSNRYYTVNYPDLMKLIQNKKGPTFRDMVKEFYPDAQSAVDIFAAPKILTRAPFYQTLPEKEKYVNADTSLIGSGIASIQSSLGNLTPEQTAQMQIAADIALKEADPEALLDKIMSDPKGKTQELMYNAFGITYPPWNETQSLMRESLLNPQNKDLYVPERKNFANEPTAWENVRKWAASRIEMEHLALIAANYAWEKKKYDSDYLRTLNKDGATNMINNLVKDTLYNLDPFTKEVSFLGKAALQAEGQRQLLSYIKEYLQKFSWDSILSRFTSKPKIAGWVHPPGEKFGPEDNYPIRFPQYFVEDTTATTPNPFFVPSLGMDQDPFREFRWKINEKFFKTNKDKSDLQIAEEIRKEYMDQYFDLLSTKYIGEPGIKQKRKEAELLEKLWQNIQFALARNAPIFEDAPGYPDRSYMDKHMKFPIYRQRYNQGIHDFNMREAQRSWDKTKNYVLGVLNTIRSTSDNAITRFVPREHQNPNAWVSTLLDPRDKSSDDLMKVLTDSRKGYYDLGQTFYSYGAYVFNVVRDLINAYQAANKPKPQDTLAQTWWTQFNKDADDRKEMLQEQRSKYRYDWENRPYWSVRQQFKDAFYEGADLWEALTKRDPEQTISTSVVKPPNDLYRAIQRLENPFNNTATDFKNGTTDFKNRTTDFKNRTTDFKNGTTDFKNGTTDFKNGTTNFMNETTDFKNETIIPKKSRSKTVIDAVSDKVSGTVDTVKRKAKELDKKFTTGQKIAAGVATGISLAFLAEYLTSPAPQPPPKPKPKPIVQPAQNASQPIVKPDTISTQPSTILPDLREEVLVQKAQENAIADQVIYAVVRQCFQNNPFDLQCLIDSDHTDTVDGTFENVHAVSKLIEKTSSDIPSTPTLQHFMKIGLGNLFAKQAMRQYIRKNIKGQKHFQILKAIINPEKAYEWDIQKSFFEFFLAKPLYDSKSVIAKNYGEPLIEGLKQIMLSPGPVFDFIERIAATQGNYRTSFNGSIYSNQERVVYNLPQNKRVRPLLKDLMLRQVQRFKQ